MVIFFSSSRNFKHLKLYRHSGESQNPVFIDPWIPDQVRDDTVILSRFFPLFKLEGLPLLFFKGEDNAQARQVVFQFDIGTMQLCHGLNKT